MRKRIYILVAALSAAMTLLSSCTRENLEADGRIPDNTIDTGGDFPEGMLVTFKLTAAEAGTATRSLTPAQESEIKTVDIIVFGPEKHSEGNEYYSGKTVASKSGPDTWQAVLPKADGQQLFVVMANASNEVDMLLASGKIDNRTAKATFIDLLSFDTGSRWDTSTPRYLPMYTEFRETVSSQTSVVKKELHPLRSVARIDIGLDFKLSSPGTDSDMDAEGSQAVNGLDNFILTEAIVYNIPQKSLLIPLNKNIGGNNWVDNEPKKVIAPTLLSGGLTVTGMESGIHHEAENAGGTDFFFRQIYVGEASNYNGSDAKDPESRACVVVAGKYDGRQEKSYYRIDMSKSDGGYYNLLRNNRYRINITSVSGPGYPDEESAFKNATKDITFDVLEWSESDIDADYGQQGLSVDKSTMDFYREASTSILSVTSSQEWTIEKPSGNSGSALYDWIKFSTEKGNAGSTKLEVSVNGWPALSGGNGGYADINDIREGFFYIKSGNLTKKIYVNQSADVLLNIEVTPTSLIFMKNPGEHRKKITVTVQPRNKEVKFTVKSLEGDIKWKDTEILKLDDTQTDENTNTVTKVFSLLPQERTSDVSGILSSLITIYIADDGQDGTGRIEARTVTVEQLATNLALGVITLDDVAASGNKAFEIRVTSEVDWWIYKYTIENAQDQNTDTDQVTVKKGSSKDPYRSGETVLSASFEPNNSWRPRTFLFHPASDDPEFDNTPFKINQKAPAPVISTDWTEHDFGDTREAGSIKLKISTNANVKMAEDRNSTTDWNRVCTSVTPDRNTMKGGLGEDTYNTIYIVRESEQNEDGRYITFNPRNYTGRSAGSTNADTPDAAGTEHSTYITFSTNASGLPQGVSQSETKVTLLRTTPAYFDEASIIPEDQGVTVLPPSGGNAVVSAKTNAAWTVSAGGNVSEVKSAAAYSAQKLTIDIPAISEYGSAPGEKFSREVAVRYGASGITASSGGETRTLVIDQYKYYVEAPESVSWTDDADGYANSFFAGAMPGKTDAAGHAGPVFSGSVNVTEIDMRFVDASGVQQGSVHKFQPSGQSAIAFPAYDSYGSRTLKLQWKDPRDGSWKDASSVQQYGYTRPRLAFRSDQKVNIAANPGSEGHKLKITIEREAEKEQGKQTFPYLGTRGTVTLMGYGTYCAYDNTVSTEKGAVTQTLPSPVTIRQSNIADNADNAGTVEFTVYKALFPRLITFSAANNRNALFPSQKNDQIDISIYNGSSPLPELKSTIFQSGVGEVLEVRGKTIVASPEAMEVTGKSWQNVTGSSLSNIEYDRNQSRETSGTSSIGGGYIDGRYENICATYASKHPEDMVQGLNWRYPTDEEMAAIIARENEGKFNDHMSVGNSFESNGRGFICSANQMDMFLTGQFEYKLGENRSMELYPHLVVHKHGTGYYIQDSKYWHSGYKVTITGNTTSGTPVYNDNMAFGTQKIFVRCVADLIR